MIKRRVIAPVEEKKSEHLGNRHKVSDGDLADLIGDLRMRIAKLETEEREARFELISRKSESQTGSKWSGEFIGEGPLLSRRYVVSAAPKEGSRVGRKMLT